MSNNNGYQHQGLSSSNDDGDQVDSRHPDYIAMGAKYRLINRILGGRVAMQGAGTEYLPMFPNEKEEVYRRRLNNVFINPSFSVAVESHSSKPFSQKIVVENHAEDARLAGLINDTDGQGNDLTEFGKRLFVDADQYGMTHILADFNASEAVSLQQEREEGNTARLVHIKCLDLFFWDADSNGLTEIRYHREATVTKGHFGKKQVKQIVRWLRNSWEVWEQDQEDAVTVKDTNGKDAKKIDPQQTEGWKITSSGVNSLGKIPLTTIYFKRTGFMTAEPPNYELAEVVLEHYQDMSDQKRLEAIARIGLLTATGYDPKELEGFSVSSNSLLMAANPDAKMAVVEHSGTAVKVGRDSLGILEDKMEELSLKPELNRTSGDVTASEVLSNSFNSMSDLMSWTAAVETGLHEAFSMAYDFIGASLAEDFKLVVYKDFVVVGNVADIPSLIQAVDAGVLSEDVVAFELKRRGSIDISHDLTKMRGEINTKAEADRKAAVSDAQALQPKEESNEGSSSDSSSTE